MTRPSEVWDSWNASGGPKYPHEKVVQFCFRNYPPDRRRDVRVLDLGCGGGVHTVFLATEGFQVSATDISPVAIEHTCRGLATRGLTAATRVEGADAIDFPARSFDLVICISVFDSTGPAVARASLARLQQVLAPGARGLFLFASDRDFRIQGPNPLGLHGYARAEVDALFAAAFATVWIDRYITTYEGGQYEQNDWLVSIAT